MVKDSVSLFSHRDIAICYRCLDWLDMQRDKQVADQGGGWTAIEIEPIFTVKDMERSVNHYVRLGFTITHHDETYAFAHRNNRTIHLAQTEAVAPAMVGSLYLHVYDADEPADEWRKAGLVVVGPDDFDYGKREGSHTDPDGNLIRFGSPLRRTDP
jgi:hypothetical protein